MANLAGKAGAALSPVVSSVCKEQSKNVLSFAIMPFKFQKDRIFQSGISLKRLRTNSDCTIIIDNDALLDSNPELTPEKCYEITNKAIHCLTTSLKSSVSHSLYSCNTQSLSFPFKISILVIACAIISARISECCRFLSNGYRH